MTLTWVCQVDDGPTAFQYFENMEKQITYFFEVPTFPFSFVPMSFHWVYRYRAMPSLQDPWSTLYALHSQMFKYVHVLSRRKGSTRPVWYDSIQQLKHESGQFGPNMRTPFCFWGWDGVGIKVTAWTYFIDICIKTVLIMVNNGLCPPYL